MDIKKASVKDFDKIVELWDSKNIVDFSKQKYDKKFLNNVLKSKNELVLVAKVGKQIIAAIHIEYKYDYCKFSKLVVDAIYRHKGVGTKFISEIAKIARKKKCKKLINMANSDNDHMCSFLEKNKFEQQNIVVAVRKL